MDALRTEIPHVAVKIQGTLHTHRELLRGILRYVQLNGPWTIQLLIGREDDPPVAPDQSFSGYIGDIPRPRGSAAPAIVFHDTIPPAVRKPAVPRTACGLLVCDNASLARAAADYFLTRGFKHFAYAGSAFETRWSNQRQRTFQEVLHSHGHACEVFPRVADLQTAGLGVDERQLGDWLARLPEHTALFVANDLRGRQILNICQKRSIAVPQRLSILSCDDDETLCDTSAPTLSSIRHNAFQTGYALAECLDAAMRTGTWRHPPARLEYGFAEVVSRQSSTDLRETDPLVRRALAFMRLNAGENLTVGRIATALNVSCRLLEMRFRATWGRTVRDVILDIRLDRARRLLAETAESVEDVAARCGFANASHFCVVFRRLTGQTPSAYRRRA